MEAHEERWQLAVPPEPAIEPLLSIADLRRVLRISESGIYRLMRSGGLAAVRIGGRTLFSPDAVRRLIATRAAPTDQATDGRREAP